MLDDQEELESVRTLLMGGKVEDREGREERGGRRGAEGYFGGLRIGGGRETPTAVGKRQCFSAEMLKSRWEEFGEVKICGV